MNNGELICNSTNITYSKGYLALWCEDYPLPDTLEVTGDTLQKIDYFHVSLLCVKNILDKKPDIEEKILKHFCDFLGDNAVEFESFTGEFRVVNDTVRKSVVALCKVSNLNKLSKHLTEKIGIEIAPQPAHVTIYTHQPNVGIGLNSPEEMQEKSEIIELPENIKLILQ